MNSRKKKVVILVDWYLPGFKAGGPIQSVASIVARLNNDYEFAIITADTDDNETVPYTGIKSNDWNLLPDGTRVFYFSRAEKKFSNLKKILLKEQPDVIYCNSLFSVFFTLYPLLIRKLFMPMRKTVLAPRGMLGKGALHIKPLKKKIFLLVARISGLYKNITWHASTGLEAEEVKLHFGKKQRVLVATNLTPPKPDPDFTRIKDKGSASFFFLSRISSKKNLLTSIRVFNRLPATCSAVFDIYGPVDDVAYWEQCGEEIKKTPSHLQINYKGPIANHQTGHMMSGYHFSLLHTQHENFGHSIIESMAAGCPVVISDQTPWRNLAAVKAGWDIPVKDESLLLNTLEKCCNMDNQDFTAWSKAAYAYATAIMNDPAHIDDNRRLFL